MKITFLTQFMSKRSGGVIEVVQALHSSVKLLDIECKVIGVNDSFATSKEKLKPNLDYFEYSTIGPRSFGYGLGIFKFLRRSKPMIIHTHGLWMFYSLAAFVYSKLFKVPIIVSPHGMLDSWALNNSFLKKKLVTVAWERSFLNSAKCVHALNNEEANAIRLWGCQSPIAVIPNGISIPEHSKHIRTPDWRNKLPLDAKIMLFLGRLHPKKGLTSLINAWKSVNSDNHSWHLVIAGWDDRGFAHELLKMIEAMELTSSIHMIGSVFGEDKDACYSNADAFILPSYSEGLPMTILEAWAWKIPVLMTRECNLSEAFQLNAAFEIHSNPDILSLELRRFFTEFNQSYTILGEKGFLLVNTKYTWQAVSLKFKQLYSWVQGKEIQPDFVQTKTDHH